MQINLTRAVVATAFLLAGSAGALAQHACHDDAFRFCRNVIPDHARIQHCLERNMHHLHAACRAEFKRG
ncbi:conserved exported hypothetical protein [Methylocella tundrae]|uniref:Cysteine rich repeat-containing protein n=1 Tax=Methylocella tundrae TaxID=227605 RepID=A0A8B6M517_METTU|nr:conserved exported hypothetical protein [Methylocella tundrae]VTZ49934.1 conserved exported hypothetical protein [Methylocella tundrae]